MVCNFLRFWYSNIDLRQVHEVVGDPQPPTEAQQALLHDARSVRDTYARDRTRLENQILAAQQTITALKTQLGIADKKLTTIEDLIGEVRTRMHSRGLATSPGCWRPFPKIVPTAPADNTTNVQHLCK